jgi:hypothetical protein
MYICNVIKNKETMTTTFTTKDFEMINDLKHFAKAIKFELKNETDLKELLKIWVNHRVNLTSGQMNQMFENFLVQKGI